MPGSLVGFTDSNQKLLPASPEQTYSKAFPPSNYEMKTSKSSQLYGDDYNQGKVPCKKFDFWTVYVVIWYFLGCPDKC